MLDLALRGMSYEEIGLAMGLSPGLAFLIADGVPADGSDVLSTEDRRRPGLLCSSTQHLPNPPASSPASSAASSPASSDIVDEWMKAMAASDGQMVAASMASGKEQRKLQKRQEGGDVLLEDASPDVFSVLAREHNEIHAVLQELSSLPHIRDGAGPGDLSRREPLADLVVQRLSVHEDAEERVLWPAVADTIDGGSSMAAMAREQEREGKRLLDQLRGLAEGGDRFDELVDEISGFVRTHVAFEDAVCTEVREQLCEENRRQLGGRLVDMLDRSPTRLRPHAPSGAAALRATAPRRRPRPRAGPRGRSSDRPPWLHRSGICMREHREMSTER